MDIQPLIKITNLSKAYLNRSKLKWYQWKSDKSQVSALTNINLTVYPGERVGVLGANGAGKSTLTKLLCGIQAPTEGSIEMLELNPYKSRAKLLSKIGVLFGHKSSLWWDLPVKDSIDAFGRIYGLKVEELEKKKKQFSKMLNLQSVMETPVRNLSLGERVKSELLSVLMHNPKVLLLDEPTIGLDLSSKKELRRQLVDYTDQSNSALLITSHDLGDIEECCTRIIILSEQRIVYDGSVDKVSESGLSNPKLKIKFSKESNESDQAIVLELVDKFDLTLVQEKLKWTIDGPQSILEKVHNVLDPIFKETVVSIDQPTLEDVLLSITGRVD